MLEGGNIVRKTVAALGLIVVLVPGVAGAANIFERSAPSMGSS